MGLEVKKGEYAKLKGWSPSYVTKLIARGLVILNGKRVDVEASDAAIASAQSVDRAGLRDYHARQRVASEINPQSSSSSSASTPEAGTSARNEGSATPPGRAGGEKDFDAYNRARADKEGELAKLARLERLEREGALVSTDSVRIAAARVAAVITQGLEQLAPRLAGKLASESDERQCALLLDDGLREIRENLAREILKIAGEEPAGG